MSPTSTFEELDKQWKATCRIIFGDEVGDLRDFSGWLSWNTRRPFIAKSSKSGQDVLFVLPILTKNARALSYEEVDFSRKFPPLSINQIKDIDSLFGALSERICYAGNIHLGNSSFIERGADVVESFYVIDSAQVSFSKYVAYGYNMEYAESVFGTMHHGHCNHSIMISDSDKLSRCLEAYTCEESSALYYCHRLFNCHDCMFSFNLRNARNFIGNLSLPPEKYQELRAKLLPELAGNLRKKKSLPTLLWLADAFPPDKKTLSAISPSVSPPMKKTAKPEEIEKAFEKTAELVLGRKLSGMTKYASYLEEYSRTQVKESSAMSKEPIMVPDYGHYLDYPKNRLLTEQESELAGMALRASEADLERFDLGAIRSWIGKIAYFFPGLNHGKIYNIIDSHVSVNSTGCYRSLISMYSKNVAYTFYALESESAFGCNSIRKSSFVIRCSLSAKLQRCFEVDSSYNCSGCYFCHNCENVQDSMFCFNSRNLRHAIGNVELPKADYVKIKARMLQQLNDELMRTNSLHFSVLNLPESTREKKAAPAGQ